MNTFFTADTHFGHENIIRLCKRPFADVSEMNSKLIENWNSKIKPNDLVYHLGDFAMKMKPVDLEPIIRKLHGRIILVDGNHDNLLMRIRAKTSPFIGCYSMLEVTVGAQSIVLCHYAMRTWRHDLRGTWHLYGHSHGGLPPYGKSCDIGVDCWNFSPVSFEELKVYMDTITIGEHPKFDGYTPEVIDG